MSARECLDIFIHPLGIRLKVKNERKAVDTLTGRLKRHGVELAAMDATSLRTASPIPCYMPNLRVWLLSPTVLSDPNFNQSEQGN
jgi:hypothetical protein